MSDSNRPARRAGRRPTENGGRRTQDDRRRGPVKERRVITAATGGQLPKWVRDEVLRSTPKPRRDHALNLLSEGVTHFAEGRFHPAARALQEAKALSPRAATIRELLGLTAYELGRWEEALRELRTFRRLSGDTDHMPVEMDCLRALRRPAEVRKVWEQFRQLDSAKSVDREARVVFGSFLLDEGLTKEAWEVVRPSRLVADPSPAEVRLWFVAARVAIAGGDHSTARTIYDAIRKADPVLPGLDELARALAERPR